MHPTGAFVQRTVVSLMVLALGYAVPTFANPQDYPQFAQHPIDASIPITFIRVELVKQSLDAGRPQLLVDVRSAAEYAHGHLPKAVSMPLETFAGRLAEIPRDIPVDLY